MQRATLFLFLIFSLMPCYATSISASTVIAQATCSDGYERVISEKIATADCTSEFHDQGNGYDSSFAGAGLWKVVGDAIAEFTRTEPSGNLHGPSAEGVASFEEFTTAKNLLGHGEGTLNHMVIPWSVHGKITVIGHAGANGEGVLNITPAGKGNLLCFANTGETCDITVSARAAQRFLVLGSLTTTAQALGDTLNHLTKGEANLRSTAEIGPIRFFDAQNNQIFDYALVDDAGNVLPSATAVPEPTSIAYIFEGCALFALVVNRTTKKLQSRPVMSKKYF